MKKKIYLYFRNVGIKFDRSQDENNFILGRIRIPIKNIGQELLDIYIEVDTDV